MAVRLVVEDGLPYRPASWHLWRDHRVFVPFATLGIGRRLGEKKAQGQMDGVSGLGACDVFGLRGDELYEALLCALGRRQSAVQTDSL